jgi:pimeloyl-ACP methyl ester carboxylesterase
MELAAAEPSRWAGVILSGAPGLGDEQDADSFGSALRTPSLKLGDFIADRLIHDKELITPELIERCTQALTPRIMLRAGRALRATRGYDARPLLGRIDSPVLLICGACDEISSPAKWRAAAPMFPDADYVEIAGAGHSPMLEKPDEFSALVTAWLDTIPAPHLSGTG